MKKIKLLLLVLAFSLVLTAFAGCSLLGGGNDEVACTHNWGEWKGSGAPLCTANYKTRTCSLCQENEQQFVEAIEHSWGNWETSQTAPCMGGYRSHKCSLCQTTEMEIVKPSEHRLVSGKLESAEGGNIMARFCCEYCNALLLKAVPSDGDEDGDGLKNSVEITLGTGLFSVDTDGDGINDKAEVGETNTNPLTTDSDEDGLSDYAEIYTYFTKPLVADSDNDGALDGKEVLLNFDPLVAEISFVVDYEPTIAGGGNTAVKPSIAASLTPEQVNTLTVERSTVVSKDAAGYMGDAFDFSVGEDAIGDSTPVALTVGFTFDESTMASDAQPTIYAIEENEYGISHMKPVTTNVYNGKATALVDQFTTYVLVNRTVLEEDLTWIDVHKIEKNYDKLEIVFVIDDSGSMTSNDPNNLRLDVARDLVEKLPKDTKIGIVSFGDKDMGEYKRFTGDSLITDKDEAKRYLTTDYYFSDGYSTHMYDAIDRSLELFESTDDDTMRMMVVLTDGEAHDTGMHTTVVSNTNNNGVNLYTIGLGSSSYLNTYFNNYLLPLANETNGAFFLAEEAVNLAGAFEAIGEKLSLTVDSDGDGLSDYYEENTEMFNGMDYSLDKEEPDTDGDGLLDGEEIITMIIYSADGTQMSVTGVVRSNPSLQDSDGDAVNDAADKYPMDPNL